MGRKCCAKEAKWYRWAWSQLISQERTDSCGVELRPDKAHSVMDERVTCRTSDRWLVQASQQPSAHTTSTVQPAALMLQSPDWIASLAKARQ